MIASELIGPITPKPLPNHYDSIKKVQGGMDGLHRLAVHALKQQFNIQVYDKFFDVYEYANIIVIPEEAFNNSDIKYRIEKYVLHTFMKYSLKVVNTEWKKSAEYKLDLQGSNYNTYNVQEHYYFEIVPYRHIDISNVYQRDTVFEELKGWYVQTARSGNNYFIGANYTSMEEVD
jgi:hypothetical protein